MTTLPASEHFQRKKTAVILMNLGTPDTPTVSGVRAYLKEFLSDQRVIEIPPLLWQIILRLFVLTFRPKKVAHAYESIWTPDGSPLIAILKAQAQALDAKLKADGMDIPVYAATTYGNPSVQSVMADLCSHGYESFVVLPLYPQYSATSTGAAFDKVARFSMANRNLPELHFIKDYHDHPLYIRALADSIRRHWQTHPPADKLLFSYHGIPKPYADKGDPYPKQCQRTSQLVAAELGLPDDAWGMSFQSRFGAQEWLKPYTDEQLADWARAGYSVQVASPAFSADCLETLEELAIENRDNYLEAGGKSYEYIPALNTDDAHIALMQTLIRPYLY